MSETCSVNPESIIQLSNLAILTKIARAFGFDAIEGEEKGLPVVTVTAPNRVLFVAMIHNKCLKLVYSLKEADHPGDMSFANHWNTMNLVGTAIPYMDGYLLKHETLAEHGLVVGNVAETLRLFSEAVDQFLDSWFRASSE
jgi:hypothetical protein